MPEVEQEIIFDEEISSDIASVKRKKKLSSKPEDRVYVFDQTGVLVLNRDLKDNKLIPEGIIDPKTFFEGFNNNKPVSTGFLAPNMFYYERISKPNSTILHHICCFQFAPTIATITYRKINPDYPSDRSKDKVKDFTIALPYIQFFIVVNDIQNRLSVNIVGYLSATNKPIISMQDKLYLLPINNIWTDGKICWGDDSCISARPGESASQLAFRACNTFFSVSFNDDLPPKPIAEWSSYQEWEEKTKLDPKIALKAQYNSRNFTSEGIIQQIHSYLKVKEE